MSKIPPEATKFYNRVANKDQEGKWYWNQPMGVHKLNTFMPEIAKKAGWDMTKLWSGCYSKIVRVIFAKTLCNRQYI